MSLKYEPHRFRAASLASGSGTQDRVFEVLVEREFFIDNLLVRIHLIIVMIR